MLEKNIVLSGSTVLVTGAAGFIGSNLVKRLFLDFKDIKVVGIDSISDYYDVNLKYERLKEIEEVKPSEDSWTFIKASVSNKSELWEIFERYHFSVVVNLAAQAGVRYSIINPDSYIDSNIIGFYNILEACRHYTTEHLVYASSSSLYGGNGKMPYSVDDKVDTPVSLYAATKKCDELLAHAYSELYDIPSTGLRLFTVYGPVGRPDMAYFSFTDHFVKGEKVKLFNYGNCRRDFTFIDDIVTGVELVMQHSPEKIRTEDGRTVPPYKIYNLGNSHPENLLDFVNVLCRELILAGVLPQDFDLDSHMEFAPMQPGDVPVTYADISALEQDFGFKPDTPLQVGLHKFAEWYKSYRSL